MKPARERLETFLLWLITPSNEDEKKRFCEVVDDYIQIKNRIPSMSEKELLDEINHQLAPYDLEVTEASLANE